ncbi:DNA polymerase Y family protein [Methylocystis sp. ATCC 49242]|uniref:Y-family DNA polymerase n=1 Tax=Methylocystis sp. ATCC 49242 TaxID=622637 RepID=UPI0009FCAFDA|nr:DNA polymerase Y family protein [Methylocystis sp. ATCC 49242]
MRFLSVFLPRLATDRLLRRRGGAGREPFAVYARVKGAERLTAVDAGAQKLGLHPGLAVADARARCPALALAEADPRADAALVGTLADWSRRFTPLAAADPPDGVLLDVSGAAHLFGGENALMAEIEGRLAALGFSARAAIAPGPALARALARFSTLRLVAPETPQEEIDRIAAALPAAALGLDPEALAGMRRAGLRRIGDLLARPRAPLAARFGQAALARLDALTCRIRDPITPRFEAPAFIAERRFIDGLTRRADVEATLRLLAADLCPMLARAGVGARRLEAVFYRVDGAVKHLSAGTSRPLREPSRLAALLIERLAAITEEGLDAGYGFDVLRLCASEVESFETPQTTLVAPPKGAPDDRDLSDLLDRLGARLGLRRVLRLHPQETHLPEFAVAAVPAASGPTPVAFPAQEAPRPLRLFERPEPIEAMALAPDGPPLRFRWRRALHEIVAYEGPERIAPPWWGAGDDGLTRDYFHAQDAQGLLFWLFREGLYGREAGRPRWYVHGLS